MRAHNDYLGANLLGMRHNQVGGPTSAGFQQFSVRFYSVSFGFGDCFREHGLTLLAHRIDQDSRVLRGTVGIVENEFVDDMNEVEAAAESGSHLDGFGKPIGRRFASIDRH
ncbi:MAG: hypothetical protein ABI145_12895 [Steroidobacteraceae bacterium]